MQKIILLFATATFFTSCVDIDKDKNFPSVKNYDVQVIDSCEYIVNIYDRCRTITHKGNCQFCQTRNQKIITDSVCTISK